MSGAPSRPDGVPTDQLLAWATGLTLSQLPSAAIERLRDDVVDGLGCGLFGSTLSATQALRDVLLAPGGRAAASCTVWGTSARAAPLDAAVINAAAVNGFELDDGNRLVRNVHGSMTIYPVLLAVCEMTHAVSGEDFIVAAAAGWETSARVSAALGPTVMDRGFYGTPMYATLGAAVVAGRALHLDAERMRAAFELALLRSSGLSVTSEEGMGKPLTSGEAVRSGLLAALLASKGARGPRHAYDHPKGYAAAFSALGERNDDVLVVRPGEALACEHILFKTYASCGAAHPVADVLADLMQKHPTIGPDTVDSVRIRLGVTSARHIGSPYVPSDVTNAQFNIRYCVAAQLLEGDNSATQFRLELLSDERLLELTRRVEVIADPSVGSRSTRVRNEAFVTMQLTDGTTLEGHAEASRDADRAAIRKKFAALASGTIAPDAQERLLAAVDDLEHQRDAAVLAPLLAITGEPANTRKTGRM